MRSSRSVFRPAMMVTIPTLLSIQKPVVLGGGTAGVADVAIIGGDFVPIASQVIRLMLISKTEWAAVQKVSSGHDWWEEQIIG